MPKCPNCGQETARTSDWACQWCGYPLLLKAYKSIPKTYKELKEERLRKPEREEVPQPVPEPAPEPEREEVPQPVPEPTEVALNVEDLYAVLEADRLATEAKYKDKIIKVKGLVYRTMLSDNLDVHYVILTGAQKYGERQVSCTFNKKREQELRRLTERDTVTVEGEYGGYRAIVLLKDCTLVR